MVLPNAQCRLLLLVTSFLLKHHRASSTMTRNVRSQSQEKKSRGTNSSGLKHHKAIRNISLTRKRHDFIILLSVQYLCSFEYWGECQIPSVLHAQSLPLFASGDPLSRGARQTAVVRLRVCLSKAKGALSRSKSPNGSKWSRKHIQLRPL